MEADASRVSLAAMHTFSNVEHDGQTNATFLFTLKNKRKCWMMLKTMFDGNQTLFTSSNIMKHRATWWPNECNMLDSKILDDVASTCWIRLAGPFETWNVYFPGRESRFKHISPFYVIVGKRYIKKSTLARVVIIPVDPHLGLT